MEASTIFETIAPGAVPSYANDNRNEPEPEIMIQSRINHTVFIIIS